MYVYIIFIMFKHNSALVIYLFSLKIISNSLHVQLRPSNQNKKAKVTLIPNKFN